MLFQPIYRHLNKNSRIISTAINCLLQLGLIVLVQMPMSSAKETRIIVTVVTTSCSACFKTRLLSLGSVFSMCPVTVTVTHHSSPVEDQFAIVVVGSRRTYAMTDQCKCEHANLGNVYGETDLPSGSCW